MKGYIKDSNGKFHLVEKNENQEPIVAINQQRPLTLEERLVRIERIVLDPRK